MRDAAPSHAPSLSARIRIKAAKTLVSRVKQSAALADACRAAELLGFRRFKPRVPGPFVRLPFFLFPFNIGALP